MYRERDKPDIKIDKVGVLMHSNYNEVKRYYKKKKTFSHKLQLDEKDCASKENGKQAHKVWNSGELKLTAAKAIERKHNEMDDHIQCRFWDPGGLLY